MSEPQLPPEFGTDPIGIDLEGMFGAIAVTKLRKQLAESHQRTLDLATRLTETDQRACDAEQQLTARDAQIERLMAAQSPLVLELLEARATIGALAEGVLTAANALRDAGDEKMDTEVWEEMYPGHATSDLDVILRGLIAPDAVQKAVEVSKAKVAMLTRIAGVEQQLAESRQRALILADRLEEADRRACDAEQQLAQLRAEKAAGRAYVDNLEQEAKLNAAMLAHQTDLAREAEARLAVATGLLTKARATFHGFGLTETFLANDIDAFLADPSRAARVRDALEVYRADYREHHTDEEWDALDERIREYEELLAAQEEK